MKELKLGQSRFIDPKTAQKLGKGLAAEYIMAGSYIVAGDVMRIDCRIIQVATGKVAAADKVEGKKDEFFALEKDLVDLLVRTLDVKLASAERTKLRRNQTQSLEALRQYGSGLDAHDQGDDAKARSHYESALRADPNYQAAKAATLRLKAIFDKTDRERTDALDDLSRTLDPKQAGFGDKVNQLLAGYQDNDGDHMRKKVALLRWLAERDLTPAANGYTRLPGEILGFVSRYLDDPSQANVIPGVCEYVVTRFPKDLMVQPQCKTYLSVLAQMAKVEQEHPGATKKPSLRERRKEAKLDWEIALLDNEPEILKLFGLYAKKAQR
jgi:hypothetical protein